MSDISLYLDQDNELRFNVSIEGTRPGTPRYRLVFEGKNCSYAFNGMQGAPGEVMFTIPSMKNTINEGRYHANLEVMIDDRYFTPLEFDASFEQAMKVTAEAVVRPVQKKPAVTASIVTSNVQQQRHILESSQRQSPPPASRGATKEKEAIGEVDGRQITVEDLRKIIRSAGR
jgi:hypothetical protein